MRKLIQLSIICGVAAVAAWGADAAAGKTLYLAKCRTCHGAEGQGNQGMAKALKVEIRDLGSAEVQGKSDGDLKKAITDGVGKMKPVSGVAGADLDNLVAFIRSLKK